MAPRGSLAGPSEEIGVADGELEPHGAKHMLSHLLSENAGIGFATADALA